MKIKEIYNDVLNYLKSQVRVGGELEDMLEWFCSEEGLNIDEENSRVIYIEQLTDIFRNNIRMSEHEYGDFTLAQDFQNAYDEIVDEIEDESLYYVDEMEDNEMSEIVAHRLADELENPFFNEWGYNWEPICQAFAAIGFKDMSDVNKVDGATNGQKIVLQFYIQGNDGPLPWAAAEYCVG